MLRLANYGFLGLSMVSFLYLGYLTVVGRRLSQRSLNTLFFPLIGLCFFSAFGFDLISNGNNDLSRWLMDVDRIKVGGFNALIIYSDDFTPIWRVVLWLVSHLDNYHWFPAISVTIENLMYFYVVSHVYEEKNLSSGDLLISLLFKYALVPFVMSAVGFRGTLAFMLFSLGVYLYDRDERLTIRAIAPMVIGLLIHVEIVLGIVLLVMSILVKRNRRLNLLLILWPLLIGVVLRIFQQINNAYFSFYLYKFDMYSPNNNNFDHSKVQLYIVPIVILTMLAYGKYMKKERETFSPGGCYLLTTLPIIIGSYFTIDLIFLRLCYSVGFLFPILIAEITETTESSRFIPKYNAAIYFDGLLITALTQGCWLLQSRGLFW